MFGKLMDSIDDDYLRYVMHVQVLAAPAEDPDYAQAAFVAADDPVAGLDELAPVPAAELVGDSTQRRRPLPSQRRHRCRRSVPDSSRRPVRRRRWPRGPSAIAWHAEPGRQWRWRGGPTASAGGPDLADRGSDCQRAAGQGRAQRAVLVRQRPQVQGLPRRAERS